MISNFRLEDDILYECIRCHNTFNELDSYFNNGKYCICESCLEKIPVVSKNELNIIGL